MTKFEHYQDYPSGSTEMAEKALLTAWDSLAAFEDDLVLVGGLAIRHLTHPPKTGLQGPVTLDVDFGIQIAASGGMYGSIRDTLASHGFRWEYQRFEKLVEGTTLYIDLLTDDAKSDRGAVRVDEMEVSIMPGIHRALEVNRRMEISGNLMIGTPTTQSVKVAEVGPMLVLKLNAFGGPTGRKAGKDAHDVLYLAMNYLDGTAKAIEGFRTEVDTRNREGRFALTSLRDHFLDPNAQGPMSCAIFRLGTNHLQQYSEESLRLRQQYVTLAEALLHGD